MQLISWKSRVIALVVCGALMLLAAGAHAQAPLLDVVQTVAGPDVPVPVEHTFAVNAPGTYNVTLTDLGSQLNPPAPLTAVEMAITSGSTIVGTPLTTPGTLTFNATAAGNYVLHVVATLTQGSPIGAIGVNVTDANNNLLYTFSDTLAPPSAAVPPSAGVLGGSFQVPTTGNYQVTLTDLQFPQALSTLTLIIVQEGQANPVTILPGGANPVQLQASPPPPAPAIVYDIFALGDSSASPQAGLYSVTVAPSAGGAAVFGGTTAVGAVQLIQNTSLKAQSYTLSLADLGNPAPLTQLSALVALNGSVIAQLGAAGSQAFAGTANTYNVFALAQPVAGGAGSYTLAVQPASGPIPLSVARAVSSSGGPSAYSFDTSIGTAGSYALNLADFSYPAPFTSINAVVAQGGAVVGKGLSAPGSANVSLAAAPASILVFAQAAAAGGLFGIDLTQSGASAPAFAATQGVGQVFAEQEITVVDAGSYQVTLQDLAFPAAFANLSVFVTRGSKQIGTTFGGGAYVFQATPGIYDVNILAEPAQGNQFEAGTYAMLVDTAPPAPTVTLTATGTNVTSGTTVTLTWTSDNATSCTASSTGSGGWSGAQKLSGSFTSPPLTTASTFTLSCTGAGGSAKQSVTVNITSASSGGGGAIDAILLTILLGVILLRLTAPRFPARTASALTVLALTALLAACGGAQSRFDSHMRRGDALYAAGDYTKASIEFRNAIQIQPLNAKARRSAAQAAERLGKPREALGLYQSVLDAAPDNTEARADVAHLLLYFGAVQEALKIIEPGLTRHPQDARLLTLRAAAESVQGKRAEAVADVERALQIAPGNEEAIEVRAGLYKQAGDIGSATTLVSEAVRRAPSSTALREILADLYAVSGQPAKAEEQLRALIALAPRQLQYRYQLATFYARAQRLDDAQRVLEEAVQALPKSDDAKLTLVDFISSQRTRAQGEQVLRNFIAREPKNYDLRLSLGLLLHRFGSTQEATDTYREVIRLDGIGPQGLIARDRLASSALQQGHAQEARDLIQQVLETNPRDVEALTLRGQMELERKDAAAAVVDFRAVQRDQPENVGVRQLLAQAYLAKGQTALAEEALRDAVKLAPADGSLLVELAQLLTQTQRPDAAIKLLEERVQAAPTDASARDALARSYLAKGDFAAAARAAEDLKTLRPDSADGFYLAGLAAESQNRLDAAQQEFERALALQPKALDALSALAHLELNRGRTAQAVALVKSATERPPPEAFSFNLLAQLYLAQKEIAKATDAATQATKLDPKWWVPYRTLAVVRISANDTPGAMAAYQAGIKAAPGESKLAMELAELYISQGRPEEAIACLEESYRNSQAQLVANNLAMLLVTYHTDPKSLDRARDLTAGFDSSGNGDLLDTGGWVHFKRAEYGQALPELERAVEHAPQSPEIHYHLGMAEMHAGLTDRARSDLKTAVAGSAKFAGSSEARSALASLRGPG